MATCCRTCWFAMRLACGNVDARKLLISSRSTSRCPNNSPQGVQLHVLCMCACAADHPRDTWLICGMVTANRRYDMYLPAPVPRTYAQCAVAFSGHCTGTWQSSTAKHRIVMGSLQRNTNPHTRVTVEKLVQLQRVLSTTVPHVHHEVMEINPCVRKYVKISSRVPEMVQSSFCLLTSPFSGAVHQLTYGA